MATTNLVENSLTFPDDGDEFQMMYLDKLKYKGLIKLHLLLEKAVHAQATSEELLEYNLQHLTPQELYSKHKQCEYRLFQAAIQSFADRVAEQQREICEDAYSQAPQGKETEYIRNAQSPDIYEKEQFLLLFQWWLYLDEPTAKDAVTRFEEYFGPIPFDDNFGHTANRAWNGLPVEDRQRIYDYYNN